MDASWKDLSKITSNWEENAIPAALELVQQHHSLYDRVRERFEQLRHNAPDQAKELYSDYHRFFTNIKSDSARALPKQKYFELIDTLEKVEVISHAIAFRTKVECFPHQPLTEIEFRVLLNRERLTPAQFVLDYIRRGQSSATIIRNIFYLTPVLLNPAQLSDSDYLILTQAGIDINSERNFSTLPIVHAVSDNNLTLFDYLLNVGANIGVLFKESNLEKSLDFITQRAGVTARMTIEDAYIYLISTGAQSINACKIQDHLCYILLSQGKQKIFLYWPVLKTMDYTINHVYNGQTFLSVYLREATEVDDEVLKFLIDAQVPLDFGSPLVISMQRGFYEAVKLLVAAGSNPNEQHNGITPVSLAIQNNDLPFLRLLGSKKASFDVMVGGSKEYLVNWAINSNRLDILEIVFESSHDFSNTAHYPISPMSCAFRKNMPNIMQKLYERNASLSVCFNAEGETPLTVLFHAKNIKGFSRLVSTEREVSKSLVFPIDVKNGRGETCLHIMLKKYSQTKEKWISDFIQLALKSGANIYAKALDGTMPIHIILKHFPRLIDPALIDLAQMLDLNDEGLCPIDVAFDAIEAFSTKDRKNKAPSEEEIAADADNRLFIKRCIQKLTLHFLAEFQEQPLELFSRENLREALITLANSVSDMALIKECLHLSIILNLKEISLSIAKALSKDVFIKMFVEVVKSYPAMSQRYYLNHVIYIDLDHLSVQPVQATIPRAPENADYASLNRELAAFFALTPSMPGYSLLEDCQKRTKTPLDKLQNKVQRFFLSLELALTEEKASTLKNCFSSIKSTFVDQKTKRIPDFKRHQIISGVKKYFEDKSDQKLGSILVQLIELIDRQRNLDEIKPDTQLSFGVWEGLLFNEIDKFLRLGSINNPALFYAEIINNLRHLTVIYEEFKQQGASDQCRIILSELIIIASECSNRWLTGTNEQLLVYKFEHHNLSLEEQAIAKLNKARIGIAQAISGTESHRTAQINAILADTMKLWGFDVFVGYTDTNKKKDLEEENAKWNVKRAFSYAYNPSFLVQFIGQVLSEHMTIEGRAQNHHEELSVIQWFKNKPLQTTAVQHVKRKSAEPDIMDIFANINAKKLHLFAIVHFLKNIRVIQEPHDGIVQSLMEQLNPRLIIKIRRPNRIDED